VGDPADLAQKHADAADPAPDPDPQHGFQDANKKKRLNECFSVKPTVDTFNTYSKINSY
jgi:hypothetical protein